MLVTSGTHFHWFLDPAHKAGFLFSGMFQLPLLGPQGLMLAWVGLLGLYDCLLDQGLNPRAEGP
jgi:hypothetical protein